MDDARQQPSGNVANEVGVKVSYDGRVNEASACGAVASTSDVNRSHTKARAISQLLTNEIAKLDRVKLGPAITPARELPRPEEAFRSRRRTAQVHCSSDFRRNTEDRFRAFR